MTVGVIAGAGAISCFGVSKGTTANITTIASMSASFNENGNVERSVIIVIGMSVSTGTSAGVGAVLVQLRI